MIDRKMAKFFLDQCVGTTDGHMAAIPNNPVLYSLTAAYLGLRPKEKEFATFLRELADALDCDMENDNVN